MASPEPADRIAELETELKQCQAKIKELTAERDEAVALVDRMREHTEDHNRLIEQWIEVFEMQQDDRGTWVFDPSQSKLWDEYETLLIEHNKVIQDWNKFTRKYIAVVKPRPVGRPLAASAAQQADVLKRRKAKQSLRTIAAATSLSLRTVQTIVAQKKRTNEVRRKEYARHRAAAYRTRKKGRDRLPQAINEQLKIGAALVKAAKGLGR
jgi:hypothetical protein